MSGPGTTCYTSICLDLLLAHSVPDAEAFAQEQRDELYGRLKDAANMRRKRAAGKAASSANLLAGVEVGAFRKKQMPSATF